MVLEDVELPKQYKDGKVLFEKNLDAWRNATREGFEISNLNLTQIMRDAFGVGYIADNDGAANLGSSLQSQINNITAGGTPISGTASDSWTINSDANSAILSTASLTAARTFLFPDASGTFVLLDAVQTVTNKTFETIRVLDIATAGNSYVAFTSNWRSATPANNDSQVIRLTQNSSTTPDALIAEIRHEISDVTHATRTSYLTLATMLNGTLGEALRIAGLGDIALRATAKIYLDGVAASGNTYLAESAADVITATAGGTDAFSLRAVSMALPATNRLYFDGIAATGNTYLFEVSGDLLRAVVGGTVSTDFAPTSINMPATNRLYFDSGGDTYEVESSANVHDTVVGGTLAHRINSAGETLMPAVDTPTANFMSRFSGVKAYLNYNDSTAIVESFNIDSVTSDDGDGLYTVNFDTNFAAATFIPLGNSLGGSLDNVVAFGSLNVGSVTLGSYDVSGNVAIDSDFAAGFLGAQ